MYNTAGSHLVLSHCTFCSVVPSSSTHPLPFPFLGSCLTAVSRIFPKVSLLRWYPSLPPSSVSPLIFPHPPFSPSPVLLSGTPLTCISTSSDLLLFLSGGTMGICQVLQLNHFSRPKPPRGPSWCGRASANLGILSCLS